MLKTKKSKQNVTILVLSVMLAIAAIFGVTAAWFVSTAGASGTVTTAETTVTLLVGGASGTAYTGDAATNNTAFSKTNIVAGDNIIDEVGFKMTTNTATAGVYVRIKLETAGDLTVSATANGWTQDDGYYYFGTANTKAGLTPVTDTTYHKFCDAVKLADNSNDQKKSATVSVTVETVQVANQGDTITWVNTPGK